MTDFSELRKLELDFIDAPAEALPNIAKAVGIAALKGKRVWQKAAAGRRLGAYPPSIDYDPVKDFTTELGPNLDGKGAGGLGIVEDTPGGVHGSPQRNYLKAEPVIEKDLAFGALKAIDQAMKAHDL